jgi:phage major head subunit gpT-like protein
LDGSGITLANFKTDISAARAAMKRFVGDKGKVLGLNMDTIVCSPEIEATILEAVTSASFIVSGEGGTANPYSKWIKRVISLPELTDTNDWYGLCTTYPLRPIIYQERESVKLVMDESEVNKNKKINFQADMRGNAGYGLPQMALKVVNS